MLTPAAVSGLRPLVKLTALTDEMSQTTVPAVPRAIRLKKN